MTANDIENEIKSVLYIDGTVRDGNTVRQFYSIRVVINHQL